MAAAGDSRRHPQRRDHPRPRRLADDAAHGRRPALLQHRPRHRRGPRSDHGRGRLEHRPERWRAGAPDARRRLVDRRRGAPRGRDPRPEAGVARRPHRPARPRVRRGRRGRPARGAAAPLPRLLLELGPDHRQRRRRHRLVRRGHHHRPAHRQQGVATRRRPRLRRADGRARVDVPHDSPRERVRGGDVGGRPRRRPRVVGVQRQHQHVGPPHRRRGAGHRLPAPVDPHQRLLRRPPARRQPVRGEPRRRRLAHR